MLIAFDLDGTICDLSHRLHYVKPKQNQPDRVGPATPFKPDWDAFFEACDMDMPICEIVELCNDLIESGNKIIFVSGRNSVVREKTLDWLVENIYYSRKFLDKILYMRSQNDRRPDYLVKYDLLTKIISDYGKKPELIFDDRQQVVDMFRKEGIRVCQVAPGQF
jgi:hypothetical protein